MSMCSQHIMEYQFHVRHCIDDMSQSVCERGPGSTDPLLITSKWSLITPSSQCWCRAPAGTGRPAKSLLLVWSKAVELHVVWRGQNKQETKTRTKLLCKNRWMDFLWRTYPSNFINYTHTVTPHKACFQAQEKHIFTLIAATNHQNFF